MIEEFKDVDIECIKVGDFSKILDSYSWDPTYKRGDI